jgi:hypothetical protein
MARSIPKPAENPFIPSLIARGAHFADREAEVARIRAAYETQGARLVVYGDRRMGKTSALDRAAEATRKDRTLVAIATFATASDPADAAASLLLAVRQQIGRNWRTALESMVGRLQGSFTVKPGPTPAMPPAVSITFGLRDEEVRAELITAALDAIHAQMESEGRRMALAIDEFQRIHEWGGEDAEWALKAALESHPAISYVLAGSKRHVIEAMITTKGRALWKQVDVIEFGPIPTDEIATWIQSQAARTGVHISLDAADRIVHLAGPRTRDIVQLAREVWFEARTRDQIQPSHVIQAMDQWVRVQSALYAAVWRARTATEQRILRALATEPALAITSAAALSRFRLGPKSTVQKSTVRLVDDEHLVSIPDGGYAFDDPFFRRWIELEVLPDLGLTPA